MVLRNLHETVSTHNYNDKYTVFLTFESFHHLKMTLKNDLNYFVSTLERKNPEGSNLVLIRHRKNRKSNQIENLDQNIHSLVQE